MSSIVDALISGSAVFAGHHVIMLSLVVHLLFGYRELRDVRYYRDNEMAKNAFLSLDNVAGAQVIAEPSCTASTRLWCAPPCTR